MMLCFVVCFQKEIGAGTNVQAALTTTAGMGEMGKERREIKIKNTSVYPRSNCITG
jgi:hypothetical protein